jgi:hypothetical protein
MTKTSLATRPKYIIGLAQATGLAVYVLAFVTIAWNIVPHFEHRIAPLFGAMMFLTAFVTSALICGSILLGYPILLALKGQIKDAVQIVAWSAAWLVALLLVCLTAGLLIS